LRSRGASRPRRALLAAFGALALGALLPAASARAELVVVLNPHNPTSAMSLQQLRLVYGAYKRTWPDGTTIELLLPASGSAAMQAMVAKVFKRQSEEEVTQYYLGLVFEQKLARPPSQHSASESLARVRAAPGAIGIVERDEVADPGGLRLVPVEGL
jgi:hypothetical protein